MTREFWELEYGEKFTVNDKDMRGMTFIKCESGATLDDGMTEVNAVNLANGEFWTIGERVEVEV
jgi:hypothetical protein